MREKVCMRCGRHCPLDDPSCERGVEFAKSNNFLFEKSEEIGNDRTVARKERYRALDMNNKLICNIRDMGHTVRALSDGKASQSRILIILNEEKTITQSKLTERLGVQPGSASEVIGKLERAGLVERVTSENDRRTCELRLTEEGVVKAAQASAERKNLYEKMFVCLTESEKSDLLALLEKVNADWEEQYGERRAHRHCEHHHGGHHGKHGRGHRDDRFSRHHFEE